MQNKKMCRKLSYVFKGENEKQEVFREKNKIIVSSIQVNGTVFILYCVYLFGWSSILIVHSCGLY